MADRDMANNIGAEEVLAVTAITSNTTTVASIHSSEQFCALTYLLNLTDVTDGDYVVRIIEGDDPGLSDGVDADATRILLTTSFDSTNSGQMLRVGYVGHKKFTRLEIDSTGVSTGATLDVKAIDGHPFTAPVANPS